MWRWGKTTIGTNWAPEQWKHVFVQPTNAFEKQSLWSSGKSHEITSRTENNALLIDPSLLKTKTEIEQQKPAGLHPAMAGNLWGIWLVFPLAKQNHNYRISAARPSSPASCSKPTAAMWAQALRCCGHTAGRLRQTCDPARWIYSTGWDRTNLRIPERDNFKTAPNCGWFMLGLLASLWQPEAQLEGYLEIHELKSCF